MKKLTAIVFGVVMLWGGGCKQNEKPADILTHEQMVTILKNIYINEQRLGNIVHQPDSARKDFAYLQNKIFSANNTDDSTFRASYYYYTEHPDELDKIYEAVIDTLHLMMQHARNQ